MIRTRRGISGVSDVRDDVMPVVLLEQARGGNEAALGELLELYRNYLRLVARSLIIRRTLEHIPFETIAADMGRSVGAVRMLWTRAVKRLTQVLASDHTLPSLRRHE